MGHRRNAHIPWAFLRCPQPMGVTSGPVGVSHVDCKTPTAHGRFTHNHGRFSCWLKDAHRTWAFHQQLWAFLTLVARRPEIMGVSHTTVGVSHVGCKTSTAHGRNARARGRFSCWPKDAHCLWAFHPQLWTFLILVARRPQCMGVSPTAVGVSHIGRKTPR